MQEAQPVVIDFVTWNSASFLPNLFASLDEQTYRGFTATAIDNASNDGTLEWFQKNRLDVTVLRNFRNQGFGRAHNQGIALALSRWPQELWSRRYILVSNLDLEYSPEAIQKMFEAMEADPSLAACGPKLLQARVKGEGDDGRRITERSNVIDSTGLVMKKSRRAFERGAQEVDAGQYDQKREVFGVSGACVMFRASALADAKIGDEYFDEDMFAYKEDVDLMWRLRRLGMNVRYVPEAVVWHHRRAPSGAQGFLWLSAFFRRFKKPAYVNLNSTRNQHWMIWKNDEWVNRLVHLPWILPYGGGRLLVGLFSPLAWKANIQALGGWGKMRKKRKEITQKATVSGADMRKWFS